MLVSKPLLTDNEILMYRFMIAVADYNKVQLNCQVAVSAFTKITLNVDEDRDLYYQTFNSFNKKYVDFCFSSYTNSKVIAIIELSDATHTKEYDLQRSEFFKQLEIPYFTFNSVSEIGNSQIKSTFYKFVSEAIKARG